MGEGNVQQHQSHCKTHLQATHGDPASLQAEVGVRTAQKAANKEARSNRPEGKLALLMALVVALEPANTVEPQNKRGFDLSAAPVSSRFFVLVDA